MDNMSIEEVLEMVNYDPELEPLLNEDFTIWDNELLQIQQVPHQPPPQPFGTTSCKYSYSKFIYK